MGMIVPEVATGGLLGDHRPGAVGQLRVHLGRSGVLVTLSVALLALLVVAAAIPGVLAPTDPLALHPSQVLSGPSARNLFGTDQYGRSVLSQMVYGARTSLVVGLVAAGAGALVGGALGLLAGYSAGAVDVVVMRLVDVLMCFPGLLLALIIGAALGPSLRNEVLAVAAASLPAYARVMRSQVLSVRGRLYIDAARASGLPSRRIIWRHVIPNSLAPLVVLATITVGTAIVLGASLSFLGLGPQGGVPDWGRLLATGQNYVATAWWITTFPGLAITLVVVAINILGDRLRDRLEVPA